MGGSERTMKGRYGVLVSRQESEQGEADIPRDTSDEHRHEHLRIVKKPLVSLDESLDSTQEEKSGLSRILRDSHQAPVAQFG